MAGSGELRYLDAARVNHPCGTLDGIEVCAADDRPLGEVDGVLVDPRNRRLCYFVLRRAAWLGSRRYLLPAEATPVLDADAGRLRVEAAEDDLARFDGRSVAQFSDDDLIAAMFSRPAA